MAILTTGNTFADGDQVTSTKENNQVNAAAFVAGSSGTTDDSTLTVNGSGRLQVKALGIGAGQIGASSVTTAKIQSSSSTTTGVTFPKMRYLTDMTVIGNVSGGETTPAEVPILDDDTMAGDSAVSLATQQSIKAYVDNTLSAYATKYSGASVGPLSFTTSWQTLDLSATVGANRSLVTLEVYDGSVAQNTMFRTNGGSVEQYSSLNASGWGSAGGIVSTTNQGYHATVMTDASGILQYKGQGSVSGVNVNLLTYQKVL